MKTLITWVLIFVFGFVVWAWVGFKILEGVSGDLLVEAWDNSYQQFQQTYPWSTAQNQLNQKVEEQKSILLEKLKDWLKDYFLNAIKGSPVENTEEVK